MIGNKEKCISPWFGFLIIVVVCFLVGGAVFFEFRGQPRHGKIHPKFAPKKAAVQAAFPNAGARNDSTVDKFTF